MLQEVTDYPHPFRATHSPDRDAIPVAVPFELITPAGTLSFFSTTTVFGTPVDITLSELALETFFPTDTATADALRAIVGDLPAVQSAR